MFTVAAAHPAQKVGPTGNHGTGQTVKVNGQSFTVGHRIGSGAFGSVYHVVGPGGKTYACKVMDKSKVPAKNHQKMRSEIRIHSSLEHKHIIKLYSHQDDATLVYLILELCPNYSLADMLKRRKTLVEVEIRLYVAQIASAVKYMHDNNIVHRDLKPGNILLDGCMALKICDFGLAAVINAGHQRRTLCGTPNFISPEVLDKNGHGFEVDLWAVGAIMYTMLVGAPPFQSKDKEETIKQISNPDFKYHVPATVSKDAQQVFDSLLQRVPLHRPSASKILEFPFFVQGMVPTRVPVEALTQTPEYSGLLVPFSRMPMKETTNTHSSALLGASKPSLNRAAAARAVRQKRLQAMGGVADKENIVAGHVVKAPQRVLQPSAQGGGGDSVPHAQPSRPGHEVLHDKAFKKPFPVAPAAPRQPATGGVHPLRYVTKAPPEDTPPVAAAVTKEAEKEGGLVADKLDRVYERKNYQHAASAQHHELLKAVDHNWEKACRLMLREVQQLLETTCAQKSPSAARPLTQQSSPLLWVSMWLDYSNKYGLSYQLSDGTVGLHFIDSTQLVLGPRRDFVEYSDDKQQVVISAGGTPPGNLAKKFKLLAHFRSYMNEYLLMRGAGIPAIDAINRERSSDFVRVYRWRRNTTAIVFQLTNGVLQANFFDHTKVILSAVTRQVTFFPVDEPCATYSLADLTMENYPSLHKRLTDLQALTAQLMASAS